MSDDTRTGIAERAMAELLRRKAQQEQIKEATDNRREFDQAVGKANGYQTAVDILSAMREAEQSNTNDE